MKMWLASSGDLALPRRRVSRPVLYSLPTILTAFEESWSSRSYDLKCLNNTPLFWSGHSPSGTVNRRVRLNRAQYQLIWQGEICRFFRRFSNDSRRTIGRLPRFEIRADNKRFRESDCSLDHFASRVAIAKTPLLERSLAVWHVLWASLASLVIQGAFRAWVG